MNSRYLNYILLAALFIIAVTYQTMYTMEAVRDDFHGHEQVRGPFSFEETALVANRLRPEAEAAGMRKGDRVLAINGLPLTGVAAYERAAQSSRPGDTLNVAIRRAGDNAQAEEKNLAIRLVAAREAPPGVSEWLPFTLVFVVMPVFSMLLGFWVALMRPRDPLAWLLLGLMLSFAQLRSVSMAHWQPWPLRDLLIIYHMSSLSAWPLWMLLFGVYFPERLKYDRRWPWAKWILIVPLIFIFICNIILEVGSMENLEAIAPLTRLVLGLQGPLFAITLLGISCFFVGLSMKASDKETSPDSRRRLRLMLFGTATSLTPLLILIVYARMRGITPGQASPWVSIPVLLLVLVFPLTLAYVIVVQRAMDVSMVIRQGVQYALARGGVLVLQIALTTGIIIGAISLGNSTSANRPQKFIAISLGIALVLGIRRLAESIRAWTDRRFFREAYNAEIILSDLSEKVRTMIETGPLLETVAKRISESLHVPRVALLLQDNGSYRPAHALGYGDLPSVSFTERSATVHQLRRVNEPVLVYSDDEESWMYKTPGMDGERAMLEKLQTQLLLPLTVKEKLPGFISLGPKQSEEPYSSTDLRLLQSVATQTGLALENSQLTAAIASEVAQRETLNREVEIAREVQERLFPQEFAPVPGLDYCGACRPALGVGGDYYDFLLLPNDSLGIAIGDVSGKGISAALLMASLQASLRGQAMQGTSDLATLMSNVNRLVYDASAENRYATFFYAQYEPNTRSLVYVNAGHNPPMIFRNRDGEPQVLRLDKEGGVVVGLIKDFTYTQATVRLEPGDVLVAFTDGISEAMNVAEEEWGEEKLIETAQACCDGLSASETISLLIEAADAFAAGAKQHDDMTLVVVRVI